MDGGSDQQHQPNEAHIHESVHSLESQADLLMRRVQRLQVRMCQRHMHKHMQSFVRREQTVSGLSCQLQRKVQRDSSVHSNNRVQHKQQQQQQLQDPLSFSRFLDPDAGSLRNMPTSALADIVRGWDKQSDDCRLPDSIRLSAADAVTKRPLDRETVQNTLSAAGQLQANVRHLEEDYDSDATESSSGGESCDDGYGFCEPAASPSAAFHSGITTTKKQSPPNLKDSTTWTWAVQRSAIACRWMWLIAQVADLEFKIRQQKEMYHTLRQSKGQIVLENRASESADGAEPSHCMRTMSLKHLNQRKLVRCSTALTGAVRKVARYSTVPCSCTSLPNHVSACVLCNGRFGYVQVIDTDCMPQSERIAILDPACHPVLTLPTQIPLGLHFSKFLKKETVLKSIARKVSKSSNSGSSISKKAGANSSPESPGKYLKDIRRSNNHKKSNALISSNKLKKKYESNSKRKYPNNNCEYTSSGKKSKSSRERHESSSNGSNESYRPESPIQSPLPTENAASRRRRSEYAYDINNIVIPYSIASTTRVEKLQYKEILTPKWREVGHVCKAEPVQSDEDEIEDLSDTAFSERHLKCEMDEKKRFLTFLPPNPALGSKRARTSAARVRCDSKGDTPAAATGNNGYGNHAEDCNSQDSEISNHTNDHQPHNHHQPQQNHHQNSNNNINTGTSGVNHNRSKDEASGGKGHDPFVHGTPARAFERRRTTSSSRTREDSVDDDLIPDVMPFEKRMFPLASSELEDLVSDLDETEADVNGKHVQENGSCPATSPGISASSGKEAGVVTSAPPVGPKSAGGLVYASSGGESDHDEGEDPEWKPQEQS